MINLSSIPSKRHHPATQFFLFGVAMMAVMTLFAWGVHDGVMTVAYLAGGAFYVAGMSIAFVAVRRGYPHDKIGLCNCATTFRLALVAALFTCLIDRSVDPWLVVGLATTAFLLDGADGWLARREGCVSAFGARFDMEVDSSLALILAMYAYLSGAVGVHILLLGLPRYLFWLLQFPLPWLAGELPPRFSRKVVCVVQIFALILVLLPMVQSPVSDILAAFAAVAVFWSFAKDVHHLRRTRA